MARARSTIAAKIRRRPKTSPLEMQAIDRTYHVHRMLCEMLDDHPAVEGDPDAEELRDTARKALWHLYEHLGGEELA